MAHVKRSATPSKGRRAALKAAGLAAVGAGLSASAETNEIRIEGFNENQLKYLIDKLKNTKVSEDLGGDAAKVIFVIDDWCPPKRQVPTNLFEVLTRRIPKAG